jgi:hypothetical protein
MLMMVNLGSKPQITCSTEMAMVITIGFLCLRMISFTFIGQKFLLAAATAWGAA